MMVLQSCELRDFYPVPHNMNVSNGLVPRPVKFKDSHDDEQICASLKYEILARVSTLVVHSSVIIYH